MPNSSSCIREKANLVVLQKCQTDLIIKEQTFAQLSKLLALAANEARLKILYLLYNEKELCPCDLSDLLQMTKPAVSQHLKKLREGKLITSRREQQTIYYSIDAIQFASLSPFFNLINQPPVSDHE